VGGEFMNRAVEERTRQLVEPDNRSQAPTMQHVFSDVNLGGFCRPDARLRPAPEPGNYWC
jgi:hypothetical protein